ncbi:MAG: hypothetical protein MRY67_07385 [Rhodovulum sp.]|nr:hypothetical protein [Rhodovulum sp.]
MTSLRLLDWRSTDAAGSIVEVFETRAAAHPERLMIRDTHLSITWGDMAKALRGFAGAYGDQVHDRDVAIFMSNGVDFFTTYLSVLFLRWPPCPVQCRHAPPVGRETDG